MAVILCPHCAYTVFPPGTRVRHHNDQYANAYRYGTAVVVDHSVNEGHLEYHILRDQVQPWYSRHSWWPWNAVLRVEAVTAADIPPELVMSDG